MNSPERNPTGKNPGLWIVVSFTLFALFNVATAASSPLPWLDEVSYSDPASSLYFEGVFRSSLWSDYGMPFWVGNVPLHPFLLYLLFKVFGFSIYAVRGASIAYYTAAVFILLQLLRNKTLIRKSSSVLFFSLIAFSATGCVAVYRNGRYDALGMLLVSIAAYTACADRKSKAADLGLFVAAFLIPWAGLQVIPFLGVLSLLYLGLLRREGIYRFLVLNTGVTTGLVALLSFYFLHGELAHFLEAIRGQGHVWWDLKPAVFFNPSYLMLLAVGILFAFANLIRGWTPGKHLEEKVAASLVLLGLTVPWFMHFVSKYTIYYTWMATIPLAMAFIYYFENACLRWRSVVFCLILISLLPGYPRRLLSIADGGIARENTQIEEFILKNIAPTDSVLLQLDSLKAYYPLRSRVHLLSFDAPSRMGEWNIYTSCIAGQPGLEQELASKHGGVWKNTDSLRLTSSNNKMTAQLLGNSPDQSLFVYKKF